MFGIKKKFYYTLSIIMLAICITLVVLTLINVIKEPELGYLSSVAAILSCISFALTPISKKIKVVDHYIREAREPFFKQLENKGNKIKEIHLLKKGDKLYLENEKGLFFEGLSYKDSLYLFKRLVRDYVIILFSVYNDEKLNLKKAEIESFSLIIKKDNEKEEIKIIENYNIYKKI